MRLHHARPDDADVVRADHPVELAEPEGGSHVVENALGAAQHEGDGHPME